MKNNKTVLIPSMLDFHFPLLRYAFCSTEYEAVILENEKDITHIGLHYSHNDLCYPCVLIIGQMIEALKSGSYSPENTVLLIPQAGDACRGSNYINMIRHALKRAGYGKFPVVSLNFKGLERGNLFSVSAGMILRAAAAIMYGDALMIMSNQTEPYEKNVGETSAVLGKWRKCLADELKRNKNLLPSGIKRNIAKMAKDFAAIEKVPKKLKKVGIVGELYVKYCRIGNRGCGDFLRSENCEYMINGFSWYLIFYIDTHLADDGVISGTAYKAAMRYLCSVQKYMVRTIQEAGFSCIPEFDVFKKNAAGYVGFGCRVADGWLIGAEAVNLIKEGYCKILCIQPFGCMPNHVCGKGIYPSIRRRFPNVNLVSVDYDTSGNDINIQNRIKLLTDM